MKTFLLSALVLSLGVSAARATDTAPATDARSNPPVVRNETRTIEITGLNGRTTIVINDSRTPPTQQQAPYALQGSGSAQPASPSGQGYQAR